MQSILCLICRQSIDCIDKYANCYACSPHVRESPIRIYHLLKAANEPWSSCDLIGPLSSQHQNCARYTITEMTQNSCCLKGAELLMQQVKYVLHVLQRNAAYCINVKKVPAHLLTVAITITITMALTINNILLLYMLKQYAIHSLI